MKAIGDNCKEDVLILIETTVPPGTSKKVAYPIIKECLIKRGLSIDKFKLSMLHNVLYLIWIFEKYKIFKNKERFIEVSVLR